MYKRQVYTDTMKTWEPPHENEKLSKEQIEEIIREVQESMSENTEAIYREEGKLSDFSTEDRLMPVSVLPIPMAVPSISRHAFLPFPMGSGN